MATARTYTCDLCRATVQFGRQCPNCEPDPKSTVNVDVRRHHIAYAKVLFHLHPDGTTPTENMIKIAKDMMDGTPEQRFKASEEYRKMIAPPESIVRINYGQIGPMVPGTGPIESVALFGGHIFAIRNGQVWCLTDDAWVEIKLPT